ncbi:hypothetical protein DFJ74DRAFT_703750 [Hyaloraphidium curvatum]|nr:hypothetical protein DFJ74DRAFT_703750 [Hyaloraphidium curvatum]
MPAVERDDPRDLVDLARRYVSAFNAYASGGSTGKFDGLIGPDFGVRDVFATFSGPGAFEASLAAYPQGSIWEMIGEPATDVGKWMPPMPHRVRFKGKLTADMGNGRKEFFGNTTLYVTGALQVERIVNEVTGDQLQDVAVKELLMSRMAANPRDPADLNKAKELMQAFVSKANIAFADTLDLFDEGEETIFFGFGRTNKTKHAIIETMQRTDEIAKAHKFEITDFLVTPSPNHIRGETVSSWKMDPTAWTMNPSFKGRQDWDNVRAEFDLIYNPATGKIKSMMTVLMGEESLEWGRQFCAISMSKMQLEITEEASFMIAAALAFE